MEQNQLSGFLHNKKSVFVLGGVFTVIFLGLLVALGFNGAKQTSNNSILSLTPVIPNKLSKSQPVQTAVLSFQQQTATSAAIVIDTGDKAASAIQLDISFDPLVLANITIRPGSFFEKAYVALSKIDYKNGSLFYAVVMPLNGSPKHGKGTIATISYAFNSGTINPTTLQFLPRTKVAAEGIDESILKRATPITIAPDRQ